MRTWDDYKKYVKQIDPDAGREINKTEKFAGKISIVLQYTYNLLNRKK